MPEPIKLASEQDYREMMTDRPVKFSEEEIQFEPEATGDHQCWQCVHLYASTTYPQRIVCEVFRPADDGNVSPTGWCQFWSSDGLSLPDYVEPEE